MTAAMRNLPRLQRVGETARQRVMARCRETLHRPLHLSGDLRFASVYQLTRSVLLHNIDYIDQRLFCFSESNFPFIEFVFKVTETGKR